MHNTYCLLLTTYYLLLTNYLLLTRLASRMNDTKYRETIGPPTCSTVPDGETWECGVAGLQAGVRWAARLQAEVLRAAWLLAGAAHGCRVAGCLRTVAGWGARGCRQAV